MKCSYSKRALAFTGYFLGFKFVEDYIFESTLNSENVVSTINTYVQNEITKPREKSYDPIQKTTQFWLMTDSAVEDLYAVLTNLYTTTELTAVQSRGVTPGIKHVAGNDQEFHREGLAVFFNEQAFREQTLRAFEGALSNENTMALMQSFNRLGLVWSSSSKALCTQVLRKEWGFNGQQETDGVAGGAYKSHFATSLSAGTTTYCIDPTGSAASAIVEEIRGNDDGNMLLNLRDAVKRYHYMLSHTNLINGLSMNTTVESIMPWWQIALYAIDVVFALLMVGSLFMMFRAKRRSEEKA